MYLFDYFILRPVTDISLLSRFKDGDGRRKTAVMQQRHLTGVPSHAGQRAVVLPCCHCLSPTSSTADCRINKQMQALSQPSVEQLGQMDMLKSSLWAREILSDRTFIHHTTMSHFLLLSHHPNKSGLGFLHNIPVLRIGHSSSSSVDLFFENNLMASWPLLTPTVPVVQSEAPPLAECDEARALYVKLVCQTERKKEG